MSDTGLPSGGSIFTSLPDVLFIPEFVSMICDFVKSEECKHVDDNGLGRIIKGFQDIAGFDGDVILTITLNVF